MPLKVVTTAGTRVALTATATKAARVTIQRLAANTGTIYVGIPGTINTAGAVSSSAYDAYLDASNPSITIGMGETLGDGIDVDKISLDASVSGEGVAFFVEQI